VMLRIATLNMYQPGLAKDDLSDVGRPVSKEEPFEKVNPWDALRGWGERLFRKADIVFLQEVLEFLARPDVSGIPYFTLMQEDFFTDLAILSRFPLNRVSAISKDKSNTLLATATIYGVKHLLASVHWNGHDDVSTSSARAAANDLIDYLDHNALRLNFSEVIVGGDLNCFSGDGPEGHAGLNLPEYTTLRSRFDDIYTQFNPRPDPGSNKRIDYLFILHRAQYEFVDFNWTLDSFPSDHPFVIAGLRPKWAFDDKPVVVQQVTVPDVREMLVSNAEREIVTAGLRPRSIGASGRNAWVAGQSPKAGSVVDSGSVVTLQGRDGPIP
jgi:hypothetical protein